MARLKSAYKSPKPFRDGGAVTADDVVSAPPDIAVADIDASTDDASAAFKQQIKNLHSAEEIQRKRASAPPPTGRTARLDQLRRNGFSEETLKFLADHPAILDAPELAHKAAAAARQEGFEPDTEPFFQAVKSNFDELAPPDATETALDVAAKYAGASSDLAIKDVASLERDQFHRAAAMVSAPVSREVPSSSYEPSPSKVTLSAAEKDIARRMGLSDVEYARGKLEMERRKRDGEIG